ncbi:inositol transporter 1 [Aplysia californica]|uniref:Inositol transporter 1 n=1 Tax=Aplysia californica TaxID=6500 RepID=A0ABM1VZA8_APLCA|nr:inositol transporter 1 [Aplysia californica]
MAHSEDEFKEVVSVEPPIHDKHDDIFSDPTSATEEKTTTGQNLFTTQKLFQTGSKPASFLDRASITSKLPHPSILSSRLSNTKSIASSNRASFLPILEALGSDADNSYRDSQLKRAQHENVKRKQSVLSEMREKQSIVVDNIKVQRVDFKHPKEPYLLAVVLVVSGLASGYENAAFSEVKKMMTSQFELGELWTKALSESFNICAAMGSLLAGFSTDTVGRKICVIFSSLQFIIGGYIMGTASGPVAVLIGRFFYGFGTGIASAVVPAYIAECSPSGIRGFLVTFFQLSITTGVFLAHVVSVSVFDYGETEWRWLISLPAFFGIAQLVFLTAFPDSPRYKVMMNDSLAADLILKDLRQIPDTSRELSEIERSVSVNRPVHGCKVIKEIAVTPHVRKAVLTGCLLVVLQQFCGINAVIFWISHTLRNAGFNLGNVNFGLLSAACNMLATVPAFWMVERNGRKPTLVMSYVCMCLALLMISTSFSLSEYDSVATSPSFETVDVKKLGFCTNYTTCYNCVRDISCGFCSINVDGEAVEGSCVPAESKDFASVGRCMDNSTFKSKYEIIFKFSLCPSQYSILSVMAIFVFLLAYGPGAGPMTLLLCSEMTPQWARGFSVGLTSTLNWVLHGVVLYIFDRMGEDQPGMVFLGFACVCFVAATLTAIFVHETRGISLEDTELLFMPRKLRKLIVMRRQVEVEKLVEAKTKKRRMI